MQEWFCKDPSLLNCKIMHCMALCTPSSVLQYGSSIAFSEMPRLVSLFHGADLRIEVSVFPEVNIYLLSPD